MWARCSWLLTRRTSVVSTPEQRTNYVVHGHGIRLERVIPYAEAHLLQSNIHWIAPGASLEGEIAHEGEELGYVLEGEIELTVGGRSYRASVGAAFHFRSELPPQLPQCQRPPGARHLGEHAADLLAARLHLLEQGVRHMAVVEAEDNQIDRITENRLPHYEPYGWHHWPEHPWLSYQFRRGLGESQEGGGTVSEIFQAASRMIPGDKDSWHREWLHIAERNLARAEAEEAAGHIRTAMNCYLRAADYFRQAEFFLAPRDPVRLATFTKMERSSHGFLAPPQPARGGAADPLPERRPALRLFRPSPLCRRSAALPYLHGRARFDQGRDVVHAGPRRDAARHRRLDDRRPRPGRHAASPRHRATRVRLRGADRPCLDYLATRRDIDMARIAVCGSSLGGYLRSARRLLRASACRRHFARSHLVRAGDVGQRDRRATASPRTSNGSSAPTA